MNDPAPRPPFRIVLGLLPPGTEDSRYVFECAGSIPLEAPSATTALVLWSDARGERIDRVLLLGTTKTDDAGAQAEAAIGRERCQRLLIEGEVASEVFVERVGRAVLALVGEAPRQVELLVDLTHGYRHFSLLLFLTAQYVTALREDVVTLRSAHYGLLDKPSKLTRMHDMPAVLAMPRWVDAVRSFANDLDCTELVDLVKKEGGEKKLTDALVRMSEGVHSGLPLEVGRASDVIGRERKPLKKHVLLGDEVWRRVDRVLEPLAISGSSGRREEGWKGDQGLTREELVRQAAFIDLLLKLGNVADATCVIEEWLVSWFLHQKSGDGGSWLNYSNRRVAAGRIQSILDIAPSEKSEEQQRFADAWRNLVELRNGFAHHGMRAEDLFGKKAQAGQGKLREDWKWLKTMPDISLPTRMGAALLTPIGKTSGVLFSALLACVDAAPAGSALRCVVLASADTERFIDDAVQAARAVVGAKVDGIAVEREIAPAFGQAGVAPAKSIANLAEKLSRRLAGSAFVAVNLTGGTTFMGLAVQATADRLRRGSYDVRAFGLIDQRSVEEQGKDPFVRGEPFWLDFPHEAQE